ncbi:hypothetical protein HETIRDRAFT_104261 [Heterobasidion irregulare TC 32-1]|uniref:Uncharacterized protein n=1 Tax=Heterobasidion irregulare (strain TC 32-1) TaxID=747525 RepID=W4JZM7_HETIT|nr:uncharacterized protein HETIRDRAFT_104261 [Heterobasidion irregulare TC 32-1]ETW78929.1 hypothetical protein HETIRDRAFT_104261 [Heterobasidion irregulare TC 32-1]
MDHLPPLLSSSLFLHPNAPPRRPRCFITIQKLLPQCRPYGVLSNTDVRRVDRGTSPHRGDAGQVDRGTSPHHPEPAVITLTPHLNNFSDDDAEDYAKFKKRERIRQSSPKGAPRDASWNENLDDRNLPGSDEVPMGVPPPTTVVASTGAAGPLGLRARAAAQLPSHGETEPIPVIQGAAPPLVSVSGQVPHPMGRTTLGTDPHSGELERHADALLQRNTISTGNPEMRIATYLDDWLVPASRSEGSHSKPILTRPLGMNTTTDDHELSSSIPMNSPSMSTESSFQLSSSPENWAPSNQVEPTLSTLSLGTYHVSENVPCLYQIQEGFRTRSWNALHRDNERFLQHIAIPRPPPLTRYEIFPYPMGVPMRRNCPSIEEMKEEGVGEPRQPSTVEQLLAGVFDTGLERLLLVLDFVQTRDRITEMIPEIMTMPILIIDLMKEVTVIR